MIGSGAGAAAHAGRRGAMVRRLGAMLIASAQLVSSAHAQSGAAAPAASAPSSWWRAYLAGSHAVPLPDGRKINLYCEGKGVPTVILESGLGGASWSWRMVQDRLGASVRVCVYDRAGYFGRSSPAKGPRSAGAEADDLAALLKAARIKPPYVLVGHSYGGYIVRLYAYRHPAQVAGLVLVDPSSEYQDKLDAIAPAPVRASQEAELAQLRACSVEPRPTGDACLLRAPPWDLPADLKSWFAKAQDADLAATMLRETEAMGTTSSAELVAERRSLGNIPVIVLEQDVSHAAAASGSAEMRAYLAAFLPAWHDLHVRTLSGISSNVTLRSIQGAPHGIPTARPDMVIDAVKTVVEAARQH